MIPILYEKTETTFTSNGIGRLTDCIRCIVTEERNGMYECEFDYPITGQHYSDITEGRIIAVTHDDNGDIQPFDIYHRTAPLNGVVTFYARHISYRLNGIVVSAFTASGVANAIAGLKTNSIGTNPFTFSTDKTTSGTYTVAVPSTLRALLGGEENSLLDVFGTGEYEFDKFSVKLWAHRGSDTDVQIRYGKNLSDIEHDVDYSDSYNGVVPFWYNTDPASEAEDPPMILVTASPVYASGTTYDGRNTVCPLDLTDEFTDAVPTSAELTTLATAKLNASDTLLPNENITVSFVQLWQTEEYANIAPLLKVKLCDTVTVIYPELGISGIRSKVIRVVYNTLLDRYDEIELGDALTSYAALITSDTRSALADLEDGLVMVKGAAQQAIADADAAHTAATTAQGAADDAMAAAGAAQTAAETAEGHAQTALTNAGLAQSAATAAQNSANSANNSANAALTQLGIVEDVVDVLNWISEHGTYKASTDTAVVQGKYYFTRSGTSPNYTYTVVANPTGNPSTQGYYELDSVDEAVSNYISSHLALTNQGLWVINDNNSYKILLASDGMYVYNPSGTVVGRYGSTAQIGANGTTRFVIDAGKLQAYDSSGNKYFEVSASGLTFGSYTGATTSDIPTNVSQLNNDSSYATTTQAQGYATTAEGNAKTYADTGIISNTTLYYASNSTTPPSKPSAHITTNNASTYGAWNIALPTYSSSYPYLYVCTETKTKGGSYAWTSVEQTTYASAISAIKTTADNASSGLTNKADKSSAVAKTQRIYYRSNSSTKPNGAALISTWVTESGDKWNSNATTASGWSLKRTAIANGTGDGVTKYLYLWCATQKQMVDGTVVTLTSSDIALDDSTTVIDGGKVITNSITATQIKTDTITVGDLSDGSDYSTTTQMNNAISGAVNGIEQTTLYTSAQAVELDINGSDPSTITLSATQIQGSGSPSAYSGRFKVETTTDNTNWTATYTSSANESSKTFSTPTNITDTEPYCFRAVPSGVGDVVNESAIVGGTVAWNQLNANGNFATSDYWSARYGTVSISGNIATVTPTSDGTARGLIASRTPQSYANRKYLIGVDVKSPIDSTIELSCAGASAKTVSVSANTWKRAEVIWTHNTDSNGAMYALIHGTTTTSQTIQYKNAILIDLTQMFGTAIADYIYSLEQATAGAGVAYFRSLFPKSYYAYNAGQLMSVKTSGKRTSGKNIIDTSHLLNVNGWTESGGVYTGYIGDLYSSYFQSGYPNLVFKSSTQYTIALDYWSDVANKNLIIVFCYSDGTMSQGACSATTRTRFSLTSAFGKTVSKVAFSYNSNGICHISNMQLEAGSTATAYEPYTLHTYALSDTELRGVPKLVSNKLVYDGDTYSSDGAVQRKYGIVDLGTLNWEVGVTSQSGVYRMQSTTAPSGIKTVSGSSDTANIICARYPTINLDNVYQCNIGVCLRTNGGVAVYDTNYNTASSASAFKTAMDGVYLVYELATPTTETAQPFISTQAIDSNGTEEYIDSRDVAVPVGHTSTYISGIKAIRASLYKAGGTSTLLAQTIIPCGVDISSNALALANDASKVATTYITKIDENGIKVHAQDNIDQNYAKIDANGMEVYKGGNKVAKFGQTIELSDGTKTLYEVITTSGAVKVTRLYNRTFNEDDMGVPHEDLVALGRTINSGLSIKLNYKINSTAYTATYNSLPVSVISSSKFLFECSLSGTDLTISYGAGDTLSSSETITIVSVVISFTTTQVLAESTLGAYADKTNTGVLRIGNGTADNAKSNAMLVDLAGNAYFKGEVYTGCNSDSTGGVCATNYFEYDGYYSDGSNFELTIDVYRAGAVVMLYIYAVRTVSIASGQNLFYASLAGTNIPVPASQDNVTGCTYAGANTLPMALVYDYDNDVWRFVMRNAGASAITLSGGAIGSLMYLTDGTLMKDL